MLSKEERLTEAAVLVEPESLTLSRISQYSVVERAKAFHTDMQALGDLKPVFEKTGLEFGGRVLLIGPPGTDFEAFLNYLATEVPLKIARLRLGLAIGDSSHLANSIRLVTEMARRNSPALLYYERLEVFGEVGSRHAAVLQNEITGTSWDDDEVLVVAATTQPDRIDREVLSVFDRVYIFQSATFDERVRVFEAAFEDRKDIVPTVLAELTEGWGYADTVHLTTSLMMLSSKSGEPLTKENLESLIQKSGVQPIARHEAMTWISRAAKGQYSPATAKVEHDYPENFLDQLYLMAVGDDFQGTQRVIESLNSELPLSPQDKQFLSRYPFLLSGSADDRLTRLMRAKRTRDRLSRIMGR
jgi:SpoVK/Ycf46/Vps4 family AAA+-type ATPase